MTFKYRCETIILTNGSAKELDALPAGPRAAIETALIGYSLNGRGDIKKLQGRDGYRLRVGQYRVLFAEDAVTVLAVYIGRRSTTTYAKG